ncbi:snRNA-activating protein complex subunit 1 [Larimichthys crocea]|uniref:snRNA-activating protein complex subunit 1 n=1 Tax=Larimichthys crocea TaxID=215358 RepID=A0A6G0I4Z6_LARCR|nr:snRNA-activating protein complex subunit 1 [Larimichthys crocea]
MPRFQSVYCDFFYTPLTEDVEQLLARFQQTDSIRYEVFSAVWREMGFSDVFHGVTRVGELKRFCRVTLATALKYFLPPYSYQIRVGGLYLMFAFYHAQLAVPPVKIRVPLRDWAQVQKFLKDSVDSGHMDVVYIYKKLISIKAIHYTAMPHFLSFQKQRKPKKEPVCADFIGRTTAIQELTSSDMLEELTNIQSQYEKLKESTAEVSSQVNMTHRDLSTRLQSCMSEFLTWQQKTYSGNHKTKKSGDDDEEEEEEEEETPAEASSSRARLLSSIKQKSYRNVHEAPKSRRHRQAEAVESSSSGPEHVQEAVQQRKRPVSLRARTTKNLPMTEENITQIWLLSAPDEEAKTRKRRP